MSVSHAYFYSFRIIFTFQCSSPIVLDIITQDSERLCKINTFPGVDQSGAVIHMGLFRAVRCTLAAINTFFIMIALQGHLTLMGKSSVKLDLLANGGLILADGLCYSGFGGTVCNAGENDTPFLQS